MKKEQLVKTIELVKEYNDDLFSKLRTIKRQMKDKNPISTDRLEEVLVLISVLLSGNIKARYELDEYLKENKAFMDLTTMKTISSNCKQDIDALKSASFNMVEVLKSIRYKAEEQNYKDKTL